MHRYRCMSSLSIGAEIFLTLALLEVSVGI